MPIVARAARLICTTPEFDELAQAVGLLDHTEGATSALERARLRAELDGLVAHLYGLSELEFNHVLAGFPLVKAEVKTAALNAYRDIERGLLESGMAHTPLQKSGAAVRRVQTLIASGESVALEFKSTARWDVKEGKPNKALEEVILKTVAAFWNGQGGTLLIGVTDDGEIYGLDSDYALCKHKNRDGFELFLTDLLLEGPKRKDLTGQLKVEFVELSGKEVAVLEVLPSPEPVFVKVGGSEKFFVRVGNSSRALEGMEQGRYLRGWDTRGTGGAG